MKPQLTFDSRCFDLAEVFLSDPDTFHIHSEARCNELAALIQQTIEDFIADALRNYEPPDVSPSEPDDSSYRRDSLTLAEATFFAEVPEHGTER